MGESEGKTFGMCGKEIFSFVVIEKMDGVESEPELEIVGSLIGVPEGQKRNYYNIKDVRYYYLPIAAEKNPQQKQPNGGLARVPKY